MPDRAGSVQVNAGIVAGALSRHLDSMRTGTLIGVFEVAGPLGAGGMGEVYRARDTRLGRDVALKVLPGDFATDAHRRTRFDREARVLAALNHPNIATLYGVEDTPSGLVLVMELVEGTTLADRLALGGRFPIAEAMAIARQVATALEAAHERGIIHRDLKPSNIVLRPDGTAKVLDFGLAKALGVTADETRPPQSTVTLTDPHGGFGPGTPAYLSPEQARGQAADTRADIWAFGCVLYEMLTGRRAFGGDSVSEVIAKIIEREPDLDALPPSTPAALRTLLRRCLEKDVKDRLRHIGDAALELRDLREDPAIAPDTRTRTRRWAQTAGALALGLALAFGGWWLGARGAVPRPLPVARLSIPGQQQPFLAPFGEHHLAVSADGVRVAYAAARHLLIRTMDRTDGVSLEVGAANPFFSPDGQWVGYFERAGDLMKVPVLGGEPRVVARIAGRPTGGAWGRDGAIVFATTEGLYQVPDGGGEPRLLAKPDAGRKERAFAWPQLLPGDKTVLLTIVPEGAIGGARIATLEIAGGGIPRPVLEAGTAARFVPTGHLVYVSGSALKAVAFDSGEQRTVGEPVTVPGIEVATTGDNGAAEFAVSDSGALLYIAPFTRGPQSTLVWMDRKGNPEPIPIAPGRYLFPRVSPDGSRIAVDIPGPNRDVWIWSAARPSPVRLTSGAAEDMLPLWSHDGLRVFFASQRNGNFDIYSRAADGATPERVEYSGPGNQMPNNFTRDGTRLLVNENFRDLSVLTLGTTARVEPLLASDFNEWIGEFSPDGKWVVYESNESGERFEIFVRPFPAVNTRRVTVSIDGGRYPMWAHGGNELFYINLQGAMMSATVTWSPTLQIGPVTKLFDVAPPPRVITARPYDVSRKDGRFLMAQPVSAGATPQIDIKVVLNWFEELKRLGSW
jgi:serine/threonine-protein kinase